MEVAAAHCTFAVRDEGPGIPIEQQPLLFDRFWTAPRSGSGQGTGLGLAIAKGIVEAHGGRIWVASVVGKGSRSSLRSRPKRALKEQTFHAGLGTRVAAVFAEER